MNQNRRFIDHYFRMFEMSEFDGTRAVVKDQPDEMKRHMILANVPAAYFNYTFDNVIEAWSSDVANDEAIDNFTLYYNNLVKACENGTGLFITGTHGLAKTTAAIIVLKKALAQHFTVYFIPMNDLADFVTSGWKDYNIKLKYQYIMTHVDFLVVDDIGRNYNIQSNQSTQFLDKLFVTRCNQKKCTILTSKHGIDDRSTIINESLLSLLRSSLIELKLIGSDIREQKSKTLVDQLKGDEVVKSGKIGKKGKVG
jgi:DNA replication protein DnaC